MEVPRTEAELLQLIANKVEESVSLDYKRSEALTIACDLTRDVTKDVSAFANSAGGVVIYGIAEDAAAKHFPGTLSPIDRTKFTKERLEHLINNIQPKLPDVEIVPVPLSSGVNDVAYVVAVGSSTTAHQCTDNRYYRRHNFEAVPMEDYEVRDVMSRRTLPRIDIEAAISFSVRTWTRGFAGMPPWPGEQPTITPAGSLSFTAINRGGVVAKYLVAFVEIPPGLLKNDEEGGRFQLRNFKPQPTGEYAMGYAKMGNPQWVPILPSLSLGLQEYDLLYEHLPSTLPDFSMPWVVHCDDAPPRSGIFTKENTALLVDADYREWYAAHSVR